MDPHGTPHIDDGMQAGAALPASAEKERRRRVDQIVAEVMERRARGDSCPDEVVIDEHPDLAEELREELAALGDLHRMFLAARKAGPEQPAPLPPPPPRIRPTIRDGGLLEAPPHTAAIEGYTILGEISAGAQGTVFRATQDSTGKAVAIKVISGGVLVSSRNRTRFDREVKILARLDHPGIVSIIDRGRTADGSLFLVMPLIEGSAADEYLQGIPNDAAGTLRVVQWFLEVAQALSEAHRLQIIHRDLKPANIRVDSRGRPHILDFGLARMADDSSRENRIVTMSGQIVGSLPWASPEQVMRDGASVDVRTDVYAVGVMMYQALAGKFPYPVFGPIGEVLQNIAHAEPVAPSKLAETQRVIDDRLDTIVLRALAKRPEDRYVSAAELADDLRRYVAGGQPAVHRKPRSKLWTNVICAILMAIIVATWWIALKGERGDDKAVLLPTCSNSIGMTLVRIPAGQFVMGSPHDEAGRPGLPNSESLHTEVIGKPFWIATTEVTQQQYRAIMSSYPRVQTVEGKGIPVQGVSWDQAVEFCRRLSEKEQKDYRLPTEAEWEYACRASRTSVPFGGTGDLEDMGWSRLDGGGHVHPVGMKRPNAWGLFDMHGNVAEWCADATPGEPHGSAHAQLHTARGGSFKTPEWQCRSAARWQCFAGAEGEDQGFRVVCDP